MRRHSNLYESVYDFANLDLACRKAAKCKRYHAEILQFNANREENLTDIQNHLVWKTYEQGAYRFFIVTEPKRREIAALPFRDRVVHHALNNILEPILDKRFYYHSYACRKGKGLHAASATLQKWIRHLSFEGQKVYALKCDIKGYFSSIDHNILKAMFRRVIKDEDVLWLIDNIIDSTESNIGIPIGNLSSQLFANFYLDALDKYVKEEIRALYYIRYMDDFLILSRDKDFLRDAWKAINDFVVSELRLQLNPKTTIVCAKNGVDFCGYRHWVDHKKVRKRSIESINRAIKGYEHGKITSERFDRILQSWLGHIAHADTYRLKQSVLSRISTHSERSSQ